MKFRKAILIVHGFAGGTYDEESLANYLELNKKFDVYQFTLPGHEKNLSKVKKEEWIKKSEDMVEWLISNGYRKIYLIGHSMGGVISTYLASKYKEVKKIVLAAPAFQFLDVKNKKVNLSKSLKDIPKVIETYGMDEVIARMLKLNPSGLGEFMKLVKEYYDCPKYVNCPALILQGTNDNLVPTSSAKYVYNKLESKNKKLVFINDATHDLFRVENAIEIYKLVEKFLNRK